ncbi:conserved hypothetical protein [Vibrio parahaemolyticus AQ3810]|nr:conserved hypothetical protein [Vibrio parahaemolyticus AQ3810]
MNKRITSMLALSASIFLSSPALSSEKDSAFVPFYFSTDTLGSTVGVAGVAKGVGQPQAALFGMGLYSEKDSYIGFLSAFNYALSPNVLFSTQMYQARFNDSPYYLVSKAITTRRLNLRRSQTVMSKSISSNSNTCCRGAR